MDETNRVRHSSKGKIPTFILKATGLLAHSKLHKQQQSFYNNSTETRPLQLEPGKIPKMCKIMCTLSDIHPHIHEYEWAHSETEFLRLGLGWVGRQSSSDWAVSRDSVVFLSLET